ncbi:multisubunit potassium/proton antiporter PhaA subunit /multisubunit potassium/proton antiporter PhaB subunit [Thiobaca trueperi]|uniref:Multisubunit potassium/proton antiporter PhaA subunit /multisubunit potassium/proton antiporter PhaB subunit n=2 Tax=Thiobaca trueperi TaxID=127458 RepID=A0A4R3N498_9GAMM|nr:multisubunit potassium/proton antiporter PhaA subunit /multisubunit potassium/proton antiporter PhaB subunit [Thiobaca trueperi]
MNMNLLFVALIPLMGAALTAWVSRFGRMGSAWTAGGVTLLALLCLLPSAAAPFDGEVIVQRWPWIPGAGLDLAFRLDGLGLLFALMILGIGLLVILYARYYLSEHDCMGRFYAYLLLFMGSMLGIVLAENLILLLIFWEMTSLSSFLLISYWRGREDARTGARMALTVTGLGGLAMLGGFLLLGEIAGSYDLSVILTMGDVIRAHPLYTPMLVLILLGAFTKSAQFPFHFWLPHAMAAPTPVSAYLHSATLVKAGVFLLARLFPVLSGTPEWSWLVGGAGLTTLLIGAWFALFKHDLKGLLAYSTISHLGLITLLFGIGTPLAAVAGVFHIINHATFKASLFMAAGIIDHECGTRDMRRVNGLWRFMPYTGTLAMVAAASMAGVPLFNGFLSKEMFFAETATFFEEHAWGWLLALAVVIAGMLAVAYSLRFIHDVFFNGEPVDLPRTPHEPPFWMKAPVAVLVAICLLVGTLPAYTVAPLLQAASAGVLQAPLPGYDLAIWHGLGLPVLMSILALTGGLLIYAARRPLFALAARLEGRLDARAIYDWALGRTLDFAGAVTRRLDTGSLQRMLLFFMLSALTLGAIGFIGGGSSLTGPRVLLPVDGVSILIALVLVAVAIGTLILHRQRLTALIVMGALGLLIALIFVKFSAPDLALTQLTVEVVTIVLLLLALYFLPQQSPAESSRARRIRDLGVATLAGGGTAALTWAILSRPFDSISGYFLANSVPGGGGANVVNVILVDFRGFDTLGEITVLALAGLGIYAMLRELRLPGPTHDDAGRPWNWDAHPTIMAALARLLLPLALLVSVFIFLRGHNLPGGGFIAGLVTAVALIMQYLTNGVEWTHRRLSHDLHPLIGWGLLIGTLTGLASLIFGYPFLTSTFTHVHWPVVGEFELASAIAFDLGVYLVVVGATLLILVHLGLMHGASHPKQGIQQESR